MDDDLRNRFRNPRRSYDVAPSRRPPSLPYRKSAPQPRVLAKPKVEPVVDASRENSWDDGIGEPSRKPVTKSKKSKKRPKRLKKILLTLVFFALIAGSVVGAYVYIKKKPAATVANQPPNSASVATKPTGTIRMVATGDNLAFESITKSAKTATGYDYVPMLENFKPLFAKADIRLCNETTIGAGEALGISGYPSFNAPTAWSTGFASVGCNLMNLGSDHTNDKGQAGIDAMVSTWKTQPEILAYSGANSSAEEQAQIRYFTVKQVKFAYLSYITRSVKADVTPFGVNMYSTEMAQKQIQEARKNAGLVLVSITWGNEDQSAITGDQDRIAQELATAGADVVIGAGTHVVQPAKILNGVDGHQTLVWFSLGNFLNSQLPVNNLIGGMAVMDFDVATTKLSDPKLLPVYMHYEWTAAQKAAGNVSVRTNFKLFPLDQAAEPLAKSQNSTTVADQTARVTSIITQFAPIKVITSAEL